MGAVSNREATLEKGSFRDPSGRVYIAGGRVFRTVMPCAAEDFDYVEGTGIISDLEKDGLVVPTKRVNPDVLSAEGSGAVYLLEHPRLPFISHPYEWCFDELKDAALLHLKIHLHALDRGVTLSDASAYNIQFDGARPVFIDRLSFRKYHDGELWTGHRQFCEQFLNPLLLRALFGVSPNAWYRGSQEGITCSELTRLLPFHRRFSWRILTHVVLPASLQNRVSPEEIAKKGRSRISRGLPLVAFKRMLLGLQRWIEGLEPAERGATTWGDYAMTHSYTTEAAAAKRTFVKDFVRRSGAETVWDLGCNTGDYSAAVLEAGARRVVGFDFDQGALRLAYERAKQGRLALLPLYLDAGNPPSSQGWAECERRGLQARAGADAVLALAFTHHLAIGRNIPLADVVAWIIGLAPQGIIEFVPKTDPMVVRMLSIREDIFPDYGQDAFLGAVESQARIVAADTVSPSGRLLVQFARR